MPYIAGVSLEKCLDEASDEKKAAQGLKIAESLYNFLLAMQAQGIEHRDLRPGNILITEKGEVYIIDPSFIPYSGDRTSIQLIIAGMNLLSYIPQIRDDQDIWWNEYFAPLEREIKKLCRKHADNPAILVNIEKEQRELEMFKK